MTNTRDCNICADRNCSDRPSLGKPVIFNCPKFKANQNAETYQYTSDMSGEGMWFHTDCDNWMYSVNSDPMFYHGKLCPKCLAKGRQVTLYMRSTVEANRCINVR